MKYKVAELEGCLLDAAVAMAEGEPDLARGGFTPSSRWHDSGPIIKREHIALVPIGDAWLAEYPNNAGRAKGCTPLIAAMRAYVTSKLGEEVDL